MRSWIIRLAVLALALPLAAACASAGPGTSDETVTVVASFYPIAEAARQVGGDRVTVNDLTPPGTEPHDLELTPDHVEAITTADVVLFLGQGFQPAIEDAVGEAQGETEDLLRGMPLVEGEAHEEEAHEGEEEAHEDEGPITDPHVWLDPTLMSRIVDGVEAVLAEVDTDGAATFASNADAYRGRLLALDEEFRTGLARCRGDLIVTAHAAFGYLAARYGLVQESISGISPEAEPDPQRLAELTDLVRREGVTTIFTEELVSPDVAEALAQEAGVATAVLNPLEGLTEEDIAAGDDYVSVMRSNLELLRRALGCS